jgi:hypothetical protein
VNPTKTLIVADELNPTALDAFDFIMNTKATYDALGKMVCNLESRAKSQRQSPATELLRAHGSPYRWMRPWFRNTLRVLAVARAIYRREFGNEDPPEWVTSNTPKVCELMAIALCYRDRFPTSTL